MEGSNLRGKWRCLWSSCLWDLRCWWDWAGGGCHGVEMLIKSSPLSPVWRSPRESVLTYSHRELISSPKEMFSLLCSLQIILYLTALELEVWWWAVMVNSLFFLWRVSHHSKKFIIIFWSLWCFLFQDLEAFYLLMLPQHPCEPQGFDILA